MLQNLSGQRVPYLSIPYGSKLDATERMLEVARSSGHKAQPSWCTPKAIDFGWGRISSIGRMSV